MASFNYELAQAIELLSHTSPFLTLSSSKLELIYDADPQLNDYIYDLEDKRIQERMRDLRTLLKIAKEKHDTAMEQMTRQYVNAVSLSDRQVGMFITFQ